jgi:hypothetical protein
VLLSAKSGAGKTTTMLTCVQAGFDFYSDDATLLRRSQQGQLEIVSLLGVMNVTDRTLEWFPQLLSHTSEAANRTGKRLVMIGDVFPSRVAKIGTVRAIVAPEIDTQTRASVLPMKKLDLLSELLPFSLDLHDENTAKEHLDFLIELLERVPCYRLKLGERRTDLPDVLEQILKAPG